MVTTAVLYGALEELGALVHAALDEFVANGDIGQLEKDLYNVADRTYAISAQVSNISVALRALEQPS